MAADREPQDDRPNPDFEDGDLSPSRQNIDQDRPLPSPPYTERDIYLSHAGVRPRSSPDDALNGPRRGAVSGPSFSLTIPSTPVERNSPEASTAVKSPLSPPSPDSPAYTPLQELPNGSTTSRTRDRGFSLRRSILARNLAPPRAQDASPTVNFELGQLPTSSAGSEEQKKSLSTAKSSDKKSMTVTETAIQEPEKRVRIAESSFCPEAQSLPNYETWLKSSSTRKKLGKKLKVWKDFADKTVGRIQELPRSKDGRHIPLDPTRKKPLIDERRGHEYISNSIRSSKYTAYNFLPRQLWAQFSKLANAYFLTISILQLIPGLSTTGTYTTIVPLLFFVSISIAKEGYEDIRRHRLDKADNRRKASILRAYLPVEIVTGEFAAEAPVTIQGLHHWADKKWESVKVGDIVKVKRDEAVPADIVLLHAEGTEGTAYVETMALDGETNLKPKSPAPLLKEQCATPEKMVNAKADVVVEDPNLDLYNFEGRVATEEQTLPLTNSEIIYRGSVLRNTTEIAGLVVFSGEECKIRMNATKNPRIKAPALQSRVNRVVIIIVIFVVALAIFNTVAYQIWQAETEDKSWYLLNAHVAFFPILTSFIILFNTMIPLSLYVSLEIIKLGQMFLMNDMDMYDEETNTPMESRTSTINEELGQVNYIFSDKTGTMTDNSMVFRKMSIAGTAWLHDPDLRAEELQELTRPRPKAQKSKRKGKEVARKSYESARRRTERSPTRSLPADNAPARRSSVSSRWRVFSKSWGSSRARNTMAMMQYVQNKPHTIFSIQVRQFLLSMALCHTCFPEVQESGEITFQAASPDEHALVKAAKEMDFIMIDRQNGVISLKTFPSGSEHEPVIERYEVLDVINFTSARKRMSVIVKMPNGRLCIFCKGADSTLMQLLRLSGLAAKKSVEVQERVSKRRSMEAQEALRRASESRARKDSFARSSLSIHRPSIGGTIGRPSMSGRRLQPIRDEVDHWLSEREREGDGVSIHTNTEAAQSTRQSMQATTRNSMATDGRPSMQHEESHDLVDESLAVDDTAVFERCFQHINDFASEGLRTLLYAYRYVEEDEYRNWKKLYKDATTSLTKRQEMVESVGAMIEQNFELSGATAIEDKLQVGVPEAIERLRRAKIKLWMLTGDKRETAINIGYSCHLIKDYSAVTVLDWDLGDVSKRIAAATVDINKEIVAHSVIVVDGQTLGKINSNEPLRKLFLALAILADSVVCCRASPSQKASLVHSIRSKVKNAITLAIGDGANDIAMIQEAHVGIGITGKEGLQAARTSDYSIAQFRFLTKLLLVHGRWNYIRTCKYTLGTFWKELLFYLTQALYQRYTGYTGTSLYESWSLSMFNTLFTSLPVIFLGIFEQDLKAETLLAIPELYHSLGPANAGFNIPLYLYWVFLSSSEAVIVFFVTIGLFGQDIFTLDNGLYAIGALSFTAAIIIISSKLQFWEIQNRTFTCALSMFLSIGGWFLWDLILSANYKNNTIYDVRDGFLYRFGRNPLWWLTLILIVTATWAFEVTLKVTQTTFMPTDADVFREYEKDPVIRARFAAAAAGFSDESPALPPFEASHSIDGRRSTSQIAERGASIYSRRIIRSTGIEGPSSPAEAMPPSPTGSHVRRRRRSDGDNVISQREPKVSFAIDQVVARDESSDEEEIAKRKPRRRSTDIQELLRRGFGNVRRSLDLV